MLLIGEILMQQYLVLYQQSWLVFLLKSHTHSLASIERLKSCFWSVGGNLLISKKFSAAYRVDC